MYETTRTPAGFVGLAIHLVGVDPIVSSHTQLCGHFAACTKKIKTKQKQRMEGRNKHWFRTAKCRKVKVAHFNILCVCVAITRTLQKSYTATKDGDSSGHCLHCSVSLFLTPYHSPTALDPCLRAYSLLHVLGLTAQPHILSLTAQPHILGLNAQPHILSSECLTLCSGVLLLTD